MKPEPPEAEKDFGKNLKTFEQLPAKSKELELLKDRAEKATGQESVVLNKMIRDKFKQGGEPSLRKELPLGINVPPPESPSDIKSGETK